MRALSSRFSDISHPTHLPAFLGATLLGIICGIADVVAIHLSWFATDRVQYFPARIWLLAPTLWTSYLIVVTLLTIAARKSRYLPAVLIFAGPGALGAVKVAIAARFVMPGAAEFIPLLGWLLVVTIVSRLAVRFQRGIARIFNPPRVAVAIAVLVATCIALTASQRIRPQVAATSIAAPANAPNVVLIFLDTFRADAMADAPNLSRFQAKSLSYDHAYVPSPWTLPSHLSVVTGYGAGALDIDYDHQIYAGARKTLAELFASRGYRTAAIFANPYLNPTTGIARGFESFDFSESDLDLCRTSFGFLIKAIPNARVPVCRMTADHVTDGALSLIRSDDKRPYFIALNYFDAHLPYYAPPDWRPDDYKTFKPLTEYPIVDRSLRRLTPVPAEILTRLQQNYRISVRYMDAAIERLLDETSMPDTRPTVVIIVGDHGEQFGEHGLTLHGNSVYTQLLRIPMIIHRTGITPARVEQPVSATDLYQTILIDAGIPPPQPMQSLPASTEPQNGAVLSLYRAPRYEAGLPPRLAMDAWSIISGGLHLIQYADGKEELYNVFDEHEEHDISNQPEFAAGHAALSHSLHDIAARWPDTASDVRRFRGLGYLQ